MFFIALEGINACGKGTQTTLLAETLEAISKSRGGALEAQTIHFPDYNSETGRAIKRHLEGEWACRPSANHDIHQVDPLVFQALQVANRHECLPSMIWRRHRPPATPERCLIADRYVGSALVYGTVDGLSMQTCMTLNRGLPMPDLMILIDIPVEESIRRRPDRRDRYEKDSKMQARRDRYLELFQDPPELLVVTRNDRDAYVVHETRWHVVNGMQAPAVVGAEILAEVLRPRPLGIGL